MTHVPLFFKQAAKPATTQRHIGAPVRAADPIGRDSVPSRMLLALLANWMAEGRYSLFLNAFSPRIRTELARGVREVESRKPVLPKWEPSERHLAAGQDPKDVTP